MHPPIKFEPAAAKLDAAAVASLIFDTSHEMLVFMFGDRHTAEQALARLSRRVSGHFAYRHATLALRGDEVLGLELGYDAAQLERQALPGALWLLLSTPPRLWWHLARTVGRVVDGYVPKPSPDAYYINNLGVVPKCRGQGIGEALLKQVLARSAAAGYAAVELDVTRPNAGAIRFYRRQGFVEVSESGSRALETRYGLPWLVRMRHSLS